MSYAKFHDWEVCVHLLSGHGRALWTQEQCITTGLRQSGWKAVQRKLTWGCWSVLTWTWASRKNFASRNHRIAGVGRELRRPSSPAPLVKLLHCFMLSWMLFENGQNPTSCSLLSLSLHWFPYLLASLGFVNDLGLLLALIWNSISALQIWKRWRMTPSCRISSGWMCLCGDKPTKENCLVTDASEVVTQLLSCYTCVCLLLYCAVNFWLKSASLLQSFVALYHEDYFLSRKT